MFNLLLGSGSPDIDPGKRVFLLGCRDTSEKKEKKKVQKRGQKNSKNKQTKYIQKKNLKKNLKKKEKISKLNREFVQLIEGYCCAV